MPWSSFAWIVILVLLIAAVLLLQFGCAATEGNGAAKPAAVVNSYCSVYQRVIRNEQEGASLHAAARPVKERIAANDSLYRCACEGWDNPICKR